MRLKEPLKTAEISTPLGPMVAVGDESFLYLVDFASLKIERAIQRLQKRANSTMLKGSTLSITSIKEELDQYFQGKLQTFKTPLFDFGTPFQKRVWEELRNIPFKETRSYAEIAEAIGRPTAYRAVAMANSTNQFAIVIPCHRVINANGLLGGYGGGIARKKWLLDHEKRAL